MKTTTQQQHPIRATARTILAVLLAAGVGPAAAGGGHLAPVHERYEPGQEVTLGPGEAVFLPAAETATGPLAVRAADGAPATVHVTGLPRP